MKAALILTTIASSILAIPSADAKGCIKGAVVGGVAGHYAGHHGMLGAAAGCVIGRHEANKQTRGYQQQRTTTGQSVQYR